MVITINVAFSFDSTVRSNKNKIRVGENGGLNQSKHQNSTIQVTRFFFIRSQARFMNAIFNKRLQKSRRLNLKLCQLSIMTIKQTEIHSIANFK
jgi:hypothetical protein